MSSELWVSLAGTLVSGICGIICAKVNRNQNAEAARQKERAERREKESRLSMAMMSAAIELGDITAIALSGGHLNGNVEAARSKAQKAREDYNEFLRAEVAHQIAKQ